MAKTVYIKLMNKDEEKEPIHVPVKAGQLVTNRHGFVVPMRPYEGMRTMSVEKIEERFEQPRTLR